MSIKGRVHSIETCGTVDGPGIRFVVFCQGCALRCQYCHNPDTWNMAGGMEYSVDELFKEIKKYKSYMISSKGGVTLSGGEPLMQPDFVEEIFKRCKKEGIHTALDTSGYIHLSIAKKIIEYTDLVLLDIKSYNPDVYKEVTSKELSPTLELAKYLSQINKPMWIRFVLVPNLTDNISDIEDLAKFLSELNNVERLDVLPFHKMGEFKWEELGYDYKLKETQTPDKTLVEKVKDIFKNYKLNVM